ncbi:hypothetical protein GCM10025868_04950 [Angustibacter aerolatus]|uniref:DUF4397 domain-containing protein n=1 Tax=Angustibacter aerolatus TaxID=1162965 RepID=A0ABQ6JAP8_9ACTN|nr:hypothetical protein [Angustibacter aerolatus]GMA85245.1 hypothetical protein GCM10025868_04950 [Angustibacter aerolatus]
MQYASAGGTATAPVDLTGSVPAGAAYLVRLGAGAGGTTPLPSPDVTGASNLSGTSGRVDLLHDGALVDRVGYGTANLSEGAPAPAASNTTSVARSGSCSDTDANATDFTAGAPTPQGTAAGGHACGAGGGTTPSPGAGGDHRAGAGRRAPLAARGEGRHRSARRRDRAAQQRLLRLEHAARHRPVHQRGAVRLHQQRPDRARRGRRVAGRHGDRVPRGRCHQPDHHRASAGRP